MPAAQQETLCMHPGEKLWVTVDFSSVLTSSVTIAGQSAEAPNQKTGETSGHLQISSLALSGTSTVIMLLTATSDSRNMDFDLNTKVTLSDGQVHIFRNTVTIR